MQCQWKDKVLNVDEAGFEKLALEIFRFQYTHNIIYRQYTDTLRVDPGGVQSLDAVPFLPIRFFKSHAVITSAFEPSTVFQSSGTTGSVNSRHFVKDLQLYKDSLLRGFELFYGPVSDWCILGLLPSYLERKNSSLVFMVDELIRQGGHPQSGFFLHEHDQLFDLLRQLENEGQKTLVIGVSFALLDFAEAYSSRFRPGMFRNTVIMETGGMKGRRKEMIRQELHELLKQQFQVAAIHSEYGMTELLSQAYSTGNGIFRCPPWMKIRVRDEEDPLEMRPLAFSTGRSVSGAINIIDLANVYSCSFIATDDAGRIYSDQRFEVLGRIDNSDLRGCSLMVL